MDDEAAGTLHYRVTGGRLMVRSSGDRRLHARVLQWGRSVELSSGGREWFSRPRDLSDLEAAPLTLQHGGPRVGEVVQWRSDVLGLSAMVLVHETEGGDGLLRLVDEHGSLPLSPAFRGAKARHSTGTQWRHVQVTELAVCHAQELPWGRLRRWAP